MSVPLIAFTLFNLAATAACLGAGVRLLQPEERAAWRSKRLLLVAAFLAWSFPVAAAVFTSAAWALHGEGAPGAAALSLAPILWLAAMGVVFALVDYFEDGVLDFGRGRT